MIKSIIVEKKIQNTSNNDNEDENVFLLLKATLQERNKNIEI